MKSTASHVVALLFGVLVVAHTFSPHRTVCSSSLRSSGLLTTSPTKLFSMSPPPGGPFIVILGDDDDGDNEEEDEDEEELEEDPYLQAAKEEFSEDIEEKSSSALSRMNSDLATTQDWGGALGKLRQRVQDTETGKSDDPSHALFRIMSAETPNQVIGKFVTSANPQTVQAMSGAVSSLLGGK